MTISQTTAAICTCGRAAHGYPGHDTGCPLRTPEQDAYDDASTRLELAIVERQAAKAELEEYEAAYAQALDDEEHAAAELARHEAHPGVPAFSHDHAKCTRSGL